MTNRVHSFSTKSKSDLAIVSDLKIAARRRGLNFSWLVLQALKRYAQEEKLLDEQNRRTN